MMEVDQPRDGVKETLVMEYVGIDPAVGLECSSCRQISRVAYSALLDMVVHGDDVLCESCGRIMQHDWTTVSVVQNIIKKRMQEANEAKARRFAAGA
jgi:hypothetical protein